MPYVLEDLQAVTSRRSPAFIDQATPEWLAIPRRVTTSLLPSGTPRPVDITGGARNVDELLHPRNFPSAEIILRIRNDFNIWFTVLDGSRMRPPIVIEPNAPDVQLRIERNVYQTFRLLKLITFDRPVPLFNATNMYDWLLHTRLFSRPPGGIEVFRGPGNSGASFPPSPPRIHLSDTGLGQIQSTSWINPITGVGLGFSPGLVLHEAWHTFTGKAHPGCNRENVGSDDSSLDFGGAWAAQYYFYRWLAEHSGEYLTPAYKTLAASAASQALDRACAGPISLKGKTSKRTLTPSIMHR